MKKNSQSKIVNRKSKRVWHIFHFGERFELAAGTKVCKNGPLQFVKLPVVGDPYDDESHILVEQLAMLECQGDTLALEGAFWRLVRQAGWRSRKYRGYLLNEQYLPMTTTQIARVVGLTVAETAKVLKVLAKYNLIERVAMPDFGVTDPSNKATRDFTTKDTKNTKENGQRPKANSQKPTETDVDEAGSGAAQGAAPAESLDIDKLYGSDGMDFANQVYAKIFGREPKLDRREPRREIGSFAGAWNRALIAGLKPRQLEALWEKSMKEADSRRVKKAKKPGAAWMHIFNGRLMGMSPKKKKIL